MSQRFISEGEFVFEYNNNVNGADRTTNQKDVKLQVKLNNPNDDYPTSRVIKQGPNGDVIVSDLTNQNYPDYGHHPNHHHEQADDVNDNEEDPDEDDEEYDDEYSDDGCEHCCHHHHHHHHHNFTDEEGEEGEEGEEEEEEEEEDEEEEEEEYEEEEEEDEGDDGFEHENYSYHHNHHNLNSNQMERNQASKMKSLERQKEIIKTQIQRPSQGNFLWDYNISPEELSKIKAFWIDLPETRKRQIVDITHPEVMKVIQDEQKANCNCKQCGNRKITLERELQKLYYGYYNVRKLSTDSIDECQVNKNLVDSFLGIEVPLPLNKQKNMNQHSSPHPHVYPHQKQHQVNQNMYQHSQQQQKSSNPSAKEVMSVAEDLLKNDGKKFIDLVEQLDFERYGRENDSDQQDDRIEIKQEHDENVLNSKNEEKENSDENEQHERAKDLEDEEDTINSENETQFNNEDSEQYSEEEEEETKRRLEETYRMLQLITSKVLRTKLMEAYKEKVAEDSKLQLIEELEIEERRKKEKEEKERKKKEKQKEKKRLIQIAKEEERKRIEKQKEEQERLQKEEQKRKTEEGRKKKEAERKKREEDQRRKLEEKKKRKESELERLAKEKEEKDRKKMEAKKKREEEARLKFEDKERKEREKREEKERREKLKELNRLEQEKISLQMESTLNSTPLELYRSNNISNDSVANTTTTGLLSQPLSGLSNLLLSEPNQPHLPPLLQQNSMLSNNNSMISNTFDCPNLPNQQINFNSNTLPDLQANGHIPNSNRAPSVPALDKNVSLTDTSANSPWGYQQAQLSNFNLPNILSTNQPPVKNIDTGNAPNLSFFSSSSFLQSQNATSTNQDSDVDFLNQYLPPLSSNTDTLAGIATDLLNNKFTPQNNNLLNSSVFSNNSNSASNINSQDTTIWGTSQALNDPLNPESGNTSSRQNSIWGPTSIIAPSAPTWNNINITNNSVGDQGNDNNPNYMNFTPGINSSFNNQLNVTDIEIVQLEVFKATAQLPISQRINGYPVQLLYRYTRAVLLQTIPDFTLNQFISALAFRLGSKLSFSYEISKDERGESIVKIITAPDRVNWKDTDPTTAVNNDLKNGLDSFGNHGLIGSNHFTSQFGSFAGAGTPANGNDLNKGWNKFS